MAQPTVSMLNGPSLRANDSPRSGNLLLAFTSTVILDFGYSKTNIFLSQLQSEIPFRSGKLLLAVTSTVMLGSGSSRPHTILVF
jgi:hypothetical protein